MISNFQERIVAILHGSPNGLTANEIAERLGATVGNISSRLSKLAAMGLSKKPATAMAETSVALWRMNKP
jgi:DNA-binding transcriptional regulator GbsR (MarR family)